MDSEHSLRITPEEALQQQVMKQILECLQDTPYVLKGGSALVFTRNLDRHTTDLDFDSNIALNIEGRIRKGLESAGVQVTRLKVVKNTATVQRWKVHYEDPNTGEDVLLKIETSFREAPTSKQIEVVQGIRTYGIRDLFEQKMKATKGRTEARDLYDITHILLNYGNSLSLAQLERVDVFSRNIEQLVDCYQESFQTDDVLMRFSDADETVLKLREAVERQINNYRITPLAQSQFLAPKMQQMAAKFLNEYLRDTVNALIINMERANQIEVNDNGTKSFKSSYFGWNLMPDDTVSITRISDGTTITPETVTKQEMNVIRNFVIQIRETYGLSYQAQTPLKNSEDSSLQQRTPRRPKL